MIRTTYDRAATAANPMPTLATVAFLALFVCAAAARTAPAQTSISALHLDPGVRVVHDIVELRSIAVAGDRLAAFVRGYHSINDGGGGLFYWHESSGASADDGLVFTSSFPNAPSAGRWIRVFSGPVHIEWWGVAGDGSDETARLQAAFDGAAGRGIVFRAPRVYGYSRLSIRDDTRIENNGATLRLRSDPGGASVAVTVGDRVHADLLKLDVVAGAQVRRLLLLGDENDIERVEISSPQRQANAVTNLDGALQIRSADVRLGQVTIAGFDVAALAYRANRVVIERLKITDYITGFHVRETDFFELISAEITTPSPVATTEPGHNGLLFETCDDVIVSDTIVHDAGEHAVRIGGVGNSSRFVFDNIQAIRPGQCGLKINPVPPARVRDVHINGLIVVDAAATSTPGTNEDGLRLEKCDHVTVDGFQVQKRDRGVSAYVGIFINGCNFVTINGPKITDTASHGIHLQDVAGAVNAIFINNPSILFARGHGIYVESPTNVLRDITMMRCFIRGQTGWGIRVLANSPTVGVNQPMILDGFIKNDGFGGVSLSTTDRDVHNHVRVVN